MLAAVFVIVAWANTLPAWADNSTRVLSGEVGAVTVESSVNTVVFDGVTVADGGEIIIEGEDVTLEVKDGTSNTVGVIQSKGSLRVVGSGNLNATGMAAAGSLTFDYGGTLTIEGGTVLSTAGDLVVNSGTYRVSGAETTQYALASLAGNVCLNGGDYTLFGAISAVHSSFGVVVLAGGTLDAKSEYVAVMGGDRMSNGVIVGPSMKIAGGAFVKDVEAADGSVVSIVVFSDGLPATSVEAEGPAVAAGSVTTEGATYVAASGSGTTQQSVANAAARFVMVGLVCVGVLVAVVAGIVAVRASSKNNKQAHR